jgi:Flp pilus assembly pilin Flp
VVFESAIQDDMAMTGTASTEYGVTSAQTQLVMITSTDALSAGLSGTQTVTSASKTYNWGKPGSNAVKVARQASDANKIMVYRYEAGKTMIGTFAAPERRVGFFIGDDAANNLNTNGWKLFDAAVKWAAGF